jgi:fatty acid desaturase
MLRFKEDRRSVAFVFSYLAFVAAALAIHPPTWVLLVLCPIVGIWCFSLATICHNAQHCPVFRNRRVNKLWHVFVSLGCGEAMSDYIPGHNLSHHAYLQQDRDPMRTSKARHANNLLNYLTFFWSASGAMTKLVYGWLWRSRKTRPEIFRQWAVKFVLLISFWIAAGVIDWRVFLLLVFIPAKFANWAIFSINYPQHDGCDPNDPVNHSRNFVGRFDNWLFFNNGYHGIHHLKPGTHWSLYPELHRELLEPTIHPALEEPSLVRYLWRSSFSPRVTYDGQPLVLPETVPDITFDAVSR